MDAPSTEGANQKILLYRRLDYFAKGGKLFVYIALWAVMDALSTEGADQEILLYRRLYNFVKGGKSIVYIAHWAVMDALSTEGADQKIPRYWVKTQECPLSSSVLKWLFSNFHHCCDMKEAYLEGRFRSIIA